MAITVVLRKEKNEKGWTMWRAYQEGNGDEPERYLAESKTKSKALKLGIEMVGMKVLDMVGWPPGKVANLNVAHNEARNIAVLRTGLHELYREVKALEEELEYEVESRHEFNVNGQYAMLAMKFDWFSVSLVNLVEGISVLNTLAHEDPGDYVTVASTAEGWKKITQNAQSYLRSVREVHEVLDWRNKVAAHRSGTRAPPSDTPDSMETRLISLMGAQVSVKNGRYVAPCVIPVTETAQSAKVLREWSLTQIWEKLAGGRYPWLNDSNAFAELNAIQLNPGTRIHSFQLVSGKEALPYV